MHYYVQRSQSRDLDQPPFGSHGCARLQHMRPACCVHESTGMATANGGRGCKSVSQLGQSINTSMR
eukprot:365760-Chlamydomonas_euryale.AAC.4